MRRKPRQPISSTRGLRPSGRGGLGGLCGGIAALALAGGAGAAQEMLDLPSGQVVEFHEMIWDEPGQGLVYRFRFIAPALGDGEMDFEAMMDDMAFLCTQYALPRVAGIGPQPNQIIISLSERATEFGVMSPDVVQVFEAYRVDGDSCIWEMF